jgi:hypothetical protein
LNELLRFLHILSGSVLLGAALWVAGDVRRTLALGRPAVGALPSRIGPALSLDLWAGVATVLTGLVYLFALGIHPRTGIIIGLVATLARVGVVAAGLRPAWRRVEARIASGEDVSAAAPAARKMGMWSGIAHTLWLVALATMVFPV